MHVGDDVSRGIYQHSGSSSNELLTLAQSAVTR